MPLPDLSPDTWTALAALGAAIIAALAGLLGGWLGAKWSRKTAVQTLEATFADKDRRDMEALQVARHDRLMSAVADYVEAATRHVDLCRTAERLREVTGGSWSRRRVKSAAQSLKDSETQLRESISKLRSLSVRLTALSKRVELQQEVRGVLRRAWNEREVALGRPGELDRPPGVDAVKAMRSAIWQLIRHARIEVGIGESGMIDQDFFVNGKPRAAGVALAPNDGDQRCSA